MKVLAMHQLYLLFTFFRFSLRKLSPPPQLLLLRALGTSLFDLYLDIDLTPSGPQAIRASGGSRPHTGSVSCSMSVSWTFTAVRDVSPTTWRFGTDIGTTALYWVSILAAHSRSESRGGGGGNECAHKHVIRYCEVKRCY